MNRNFSLKRAALLALALILFSTLVAGAGALAPNIKTTLSASVARDGRQVSLEDAGRVYPGENISWTITLVNRGDALARNINIVGDIPQGTVFVPDSASGDRVVSVKYSLDHQAFSEHPMVRYNDGGVIRERPATPDEYKAIQLTFAQVGAGETLKAAYSTRVR